MSVRVVLADDQALLRKGFRMILEAEDGIDIVGEAADGADAVRLVDLYRPDVVLMDVRMPVMDGIEATRRLHSEVPEVRVIGLSMNEPIELEETMRDAGASAYLCKSAPFDDIVAAVRGS